jgi:hypothetical protein
MAKRRRLRVAIFWLMLAGGTILGGPFDPKEIEDILRIMNEANVEVVLEKGDSPPSKYEIPVYELEPLTDGHVRKNRGIGWSSWLRRWVLGRGVVSRRL